jgi:hypothetical protein
MSRLADHPVAGADDGQGLGDADRILLLSLRAWAPAASSEVGSGRPPGGGLHARLLSRLEASWRRRILDAEAIETMPAADRAEARHRLREAHAAEARIDPARVHPSWWVRALREESPSVRRAVVAAAPGPIRRRVQADLLLDNDDLRAERPADPDVLAWACSLWSERLVGGEPSRGDDPPVIVAMSGLSLRSAFRLCRYAGEIKLAIAGRGGAEWVGPFVASAGPEFVVIARHDIGSAAAANRSTRRLSARIGLLTVARLLADCEPFRVRWALQHWPYAIAKLVRALMPSAEKRSPVMRHVEAEVFRSARDRLGEFGSDSRPGHRLD